MAPAKDPAMSETSGILSAVLLADSFAENFVPATIEKPKVLLELVNVPLIEYTLQWLAAAEVDEVFVFCCAHAEQIQAYLKQSRWHRNPHMRVIVVTSTSCLSLGEALRLIDQKDVVKSDFILVSGDVVANVNLKGILQAHKARRQQDKASIMTLVMQSAADPRQQRWSGESGVLLEMDPISKRLLRYEELGRHKQRHHVPVDAVFYSERDAVELRSDMLATHIYICAPEVLMLFSDNFDYQNVQQDFISGVLSEEELGNKLFVHELQRGYACRVHNLRTYDAVSRAVLQRWTFPFVLDTNVLHLLTKPSNYFYHRKNIYQEKDVSIARSAIIGRDTAIGAGTSIGDDCQIQCSVIGRNCKIGKRVVLRGCYIHANVVIWDQAQLEAAFVCEGAVIMSGAVLHPGCILSFQVVIGAEHEVPPYARISLCPKLRQQASFADMDEEYNAAGHISASPRSQEASVKGEKDGEQGSLQGPSQEVLAAAQSLAAGRAPKVSVEFDEEVVGQGGAGYAWPAPQDPHHIRCFSIATPPPLDHCDWSSDSDEGSILDREADHVETVTMDPEALFKKEVVETFLRCVKMGFDQELAVIELNGLKIAEDRTFADCARYVFGGILDLCLPPPCHTKDEYCSLYHTTAPDVSMQTGRAELLKRLSAKLKKWTPLLQRFLKSEDEQVELLLTLEEYCEEGGGDDNPHGACFEAVFQQVTKLLYDEEVLEENAVLAWADEKTMAEEHERKYLQKAAAFVAWLREAESEEETVSDSSG